MERKVLQKALESAEDHVKSLKYELQRVNEEHAQIEEFISSAEAGEKASFTGSSSVEPVGGKRGVAGKDGANTEVLVDLRHELMHQIGDRVEDMRVYKTLRYLDNTKPRPLEVYGQAALGDLRGVDSRHPYHVKVFAGPNASMCCTANVDNSTTFSQLLQFVCEFWRLDMEDFCLQANWSARSEIYTPHVYEMDESVKACLAELNFDSRRGLGCNGVSENPMATTRNLLPPLYLVQLDQEAVSPHFVVDNIRYTGVKLQQLRRLFADRDPFETGLVEFSTLCQVVHDYFEGFFFDRFTLLYFFQEKSELVSKRKLTMDPLDTKKLLEVIDFDSCVYIVNCLNRVHMAASISDQEKELNEKATDSGSSTSFSELKVSPDRVYRWVISFSLTGDQDSSSRDSPITNLIQDDIEFVVFENAVKQTVPVNERVIQDWWVGMFQDLDRTVSQDEFAAKWPALYNCNIDIGDGSSSSGVSEHNEAENEEEKTKLGTAIERAVIRYEQALERTKELSGATTSSYSLYVYDVLATILALVLAYVALFLVFYSGHSATNEQFTRALIDTEFVCDHFINQTQIGVEALVTKASFETIFNTQCIWSFINSPLYHLYYSHEFARPVDNTSTFWKTLSYNRIVPEFTLVRQLKVKPQQCEGPIPDQSYFASNLCLNSYNEGSKQTSTIVPSERLLNSSNITEQVFNRKYRSAFTWTEFPDLEPIQGKYGLYDGSGYAFKFGTFNTNSSVPWSTRVQQSMEEWAEDSKNLQLLNWISDDIRAMVINIGLYNPNMGLYINLELMIELSSGNMVNIDYIFKQFKPATVSGTGYNYSQYLRWFVLFIIGAAFCIKTYLIMSISQKKKKDATVHEKADRDTNSEPENKKKQLKRKRFLARVSLFFSSIKNSTTLVFDLVLIVWVIVCIGVSQSYVFNQQRTELQSVLPVLPWNGEDTYKAYARVSQFDALLVLMLSVKLCNWLNLSSSSSIFTRVIVVAKGFLIVVFLMLLLAMVGVCIMILFSELGTDHYFEDFHSAFNRVAFATFRLGLEFNSLLGTPFATAPLLYIIVAFIDVFVCLLIWALFISVYFYFYTYEFELLRVRDKQRTAWQTITRALVLTSCCNNCKHKKNPEPNHAINSAISPRSAPGPSFHGLEDGNLKSEQNEVLLELQNIKS
uniref:Polycystin domain-containing protein n=1 Tax=Mucochytrium quahogii TaxID=96639 RepID=A0A7S2RGH0_9STRA|mmetsp:Transcript_29925/g.47547  ORF Transcript_29925/g.47547 Transcript_29925/m.47547 type:complete len:1159 (+) Transcript_29925:230-3706(+)|eukprot:CAMPEP_0203752780 /NCGR_PEP_ID=MMETSP0098-20131031/6643_1 /ASSEMBLY_ACC=CAM_ASM_000208 /TAXON_ID=96639 /ORGANISM=" , Strain NY0313808BC1" /LENGTH=1158 /DNA_ID=CAMNT_0050643089 /DNA_START=457 /DNA_END=3933 /DNA_ORIENTATION=+